MKLHHGAGHERIRKRCCSLDEALDARAICRKLEIPFYVLDFQKEFKKDVMDYFIDEYQKGQTPNPCVMCNRKIKSGPLIKKTMELDCDFLATGHYASVRINPDGKRLQLIRPADSEKDQTYFLHGISNSELKKMIFPLAKLKKKDVRQLAQEHELISADKEESQEICFVPKDYRQFLKPRCQSLHLLEDLWTHTAMILEDMKDSCTTRLDNEEGLGSVIQLRIMSFNLMQTIMR